MGNPRAFCRRVMHNIVIDRARAQQWRPRELFTIRDSGDPRSGDLVTAVELRTALLAGLGALTSQQRAIVVLRYFEDMSENEVADLLGISVGAVKSTAASRAVAQLRVQPGCPFAIGSEPRVGGDLGGSGPAARIFRVPGGRLPSDLSHFLVGGLALCFTRVGLVVDGIIRVRA
jgi:hypothetical protein